MQTPLHIFVSTQKKRHQACRRGRNSKKLLAPGVEKGFGEGTQDERGDTGREKEIEVPHVQIMSHQESVCTGQKDSVVPVTSKTHLTSHTACYIPLWRKSKEVLQPFPSGSQLCNSMSPTTETLGS